jgi:hypothetical protein
MIKSKIKDLLVSEIIRQSSKLEMRTNREEIARLQELISSLNSLLDADEEDLTKRIHSAIYFCDKENKSID